MKDILVQAYLRSGEESLESLKTKYGIRVSRGIAYPHLVQLKYDQLESPMGLPLVQQCRGLILDEADGWRTVARPFDKFFNLGEHYAANLDWSQPVQVQEKLDGSLIIMYWYGGGWQVATSGVPDASGEIYPGRTFAQAFWDTYLQHGYPHLTRDCAYFTFMFEFTSPANRVVVRQRQSRIRVIGARSIQDGSELNLIDLANVGTGWPVVQTFPFNSIEEVLDTLPDMDPLRQEGYVLVDHRSHRLKVKCPAYLRLHHLRGNGTPSPKRILDVIRRGEAPEILANWPEWTDAFRAVQLDYDRLVSLIKAAWADHQRHPLGKEFALAVKGYPFSGVLFSLKRGHTSSIKEALKGMYLDTLVDLTQRCKRVPGP